MHLNQIQDGLKGNNFIVNCNSSKRFSLIDIVLYCWLILKKIQFWTLNLNRYMTTFMTNFTFFDILYFWNKVQLKITRCFEMSQYYYFNHHVCPFFCSFSICLSHSLKQRAYQRAVIVKTSLQSKNFLM